MIRAMGTYVFVFYACLDLIMATLVFFFLKETRGRTLEEMEALFHSKAAFDNEAARKRALERSSEDRFSDVDTDVHVTKNGADPVR